MKLGNIVKIIVNYPPNFDGCLEIGVHEVNFVNRAYVYAFTHAAIGNEWETLVQVAKDILKQDERQKRIKS